MTLPGYQLLADRSCLNPDDLVMRTTSQLSVAVHPARKKKKRKLEKPPVELCCIWLVIFKFLVSIFVIAHWGLQPNKSHSHNIALCISELAPHLQSCSGWVTDIVYFWQISFHYECISNVIFVGSQGICTVNMLSVNDVHTVPAFSAPLSWNMS